MKVASLAILIFYSNITCIFCTSYILARNNNILDVDFINSMTDGNKAAEEVMKGNIDRMNAFQYQYEAKKPSKMPYEVKPLIPKVMHHVWEGDLPPLYQNYFNECKKLHPEWKFKIWSEKDLMEIGLEYQDVYDKMRNYPGKADIARYEILYKFGGVYRDMDVKCFRSIDDLNHQYEFYAPIEFPTLYWDKTLVLNNGVIGSTVGNPIIKSTLDIIREGFDKSWDNFDQDLEMEKLGFMVAKTSMLPLTQGFLKNSKLNDKNIALPATYFYSLAKLTYNTFTAAINSLLTRKNSRSAFGFLRPEGLMQHNFLKTEIPYVTFQEGSKVKDPEIGRIFDNLRPTEKRVFKVFAQIYDDNSPKMSSWSKQTKIPQVINFVVFNHDEFDQLTANLPYWRALNGDFDIKIWNQEEINKRFDSLKDILKSQLSENLRFYLGLKILEKFGGVYSHFKTLPYKPLFELNNKYNFYAGLVPLTKSKSQFLLSQKLLGASKMHPIISKAISKINLQDNKSLSNIDEILKNESYKNICFYNSINGRNIVFPAIYFEPLYFDDKPDFFITDEIIRFFTRQQRAFSELTWVSIIQ